MPTSAWVGNLRILALGLLAGCVDGGVDDPDPHDQDELAEDSAALVVCGTSVQAAINAAPQDSVLEICAGTYHERLVIDGKRIELRGVSGAQATTIDAGGSGRALEVKNVGGIGVRVTGLTLRNGNTSSTGGGLSCRTSTLKVRDSVLVANRATGGGGLAATSCALDIARTRFENNDSGSGPGGGALLTSSTGMLAFSTFLDNRAGSGGGIATSGGAAEIADNELRGNRATRGGGLHLSSDAAVRRNQIIDNEGTWTAGGIYVDQHAPTIEGNTVDQNTSVNDGAGFYVHQGAAVLLDNVITGNVSGDDGGGVRLFESRARLERNVIEGNQAADGGGGVRISHLPCLLIDNLIRNNLATVGGGVDLDNDSSVVRGGTVSGNHATSGGGIAVTLAPWSGGTIEDVQIIDNVATSRGGGLYVVDNFQSIQMRGLIVRGNQAGRGGGLFVRSTHHTLNNSLFDGNAASGDGGAIHVAASTWTAACPCPPTAPNGNLDFLVAYRNTAASGSALWTAATGLSLENSILADNPGTAVRVGAAIAPPTYRYNDTRPRSFSGMADLTGSSGNISADPLFLDPVRGNFGLGAGSPAIDAADPALQDANGTRADMGMFGGAGGDSPAPADGPTAILEADASVAAAQPTVNFGGATTIVADTSPLAEAYLRFAVTGTSGPVTSARLQLTVSNGTSDAPGLVAAASTWDESTITWNTRPARSGGVVADLGAVAAGTVVEYDVTALVTGNGTYTMALVPTSSDGFAAFSREGTTRPRLIVAVGEPEAGATAVLEADTYAAAATPDASFGAATSISSDASPLEEGYLRFRVTGATTPVTGARLRLHVTDATSDGPAIYAAGSAWNEATLTWNNRPARIGGVVADLGAASLGQIVEYDVSALVTGDGVYSFALVPTSSSGFAVSSRESGSPPELILEP